MKSKLLLLLLLLLFLGLVNYAFFVNLRNLPDANYPLILIVINLNLVFLIVVSAVVFRKLVKVYSERSRHRLRRKITTALLFYLLVPLFTLNLLSVFFVLQSTKTYTSGRMRELSKEALALYEQLSDYERRLIGEKRELLKRLSTDELRSLPFVSYAVERPCSFDALETEGSYLLCLDGRRVVALKKERDFTESLERFGKLASDLRSFVKAKDIITGVYAFMVVAVGLMALLATVWFSMFLARSISEPIERLTEKAVEISKGNLSVEIPETETGDEIEKLSRAFRQMQKSLLKLYGSLKEEKESLKRLLDALPVAVLFRGKDGSTFVNGTFLKMFGRPGKLEDFLKRVERDPNFRLERLKTPEGELYIVEDVRPIVLAERFRVWREAVRRIAHEIKNPLTPITVNLERLLRSAERNALEPEKVKELLALVLQEVHRINRLVSQFKSISSERPLKPSRFKLSDLINELKTFYASAGLTLELKGDRELYADRGMLKEVFYNLLNNSLEHGAKRVKITVTDDRLLYEDDGKGLTEEELEHLFEPYFSKNPKGFGIGMSIVKRVVEEHGWRVRALPSDKGFKLEVLFS
ncbi:MAG: HAMP domain-containing protein [Aquificae bacterium]|nr:HAMP domain-containing protein [Aquificota bacterium]